MMAGERITECRVLWTAEDVAAATGGHYTRPFEARGVSIDSRTVRPGDLFVALSGPRFDGHDFVADALARGAAAAVARRAPPKVAADAALLMVKDTMAALLGLGGAGRARARARVIAVTGSVGKTGTKEALKLVLGRQRPTAANEGSLNNHWGLPLSLARMAPDAGFGVFEMGMNHAGEIEPLSRLARPHVALVTWVASVHSAFFSNVEEIADAKAEVFAGMQPDGVAVLNRDSRHFSRLAAAASARGVNTIISFGVHPDAVVRLVEAVPEPEGSRVVASVSGKGATFRVGVAGRHWVMNSLAVLATVTAAGGDVAAASAALTDLRALEGRGRCHTVAVGEGSLRLIDESYNASPVSMDAAIEVLGQARPGPGGRRIAVLGDMLELGPETVALHAALARPLTDWGIDLVFTAGPDMVHLSQALPGSMRGGGEVDADRLLPLVTAAVRRGDVVMVKGSAGSRMGVVVRGLLAFRSGRAAAPARRVANRG